MKKIINFVTNGWVILFSIVTVFVSFGVWGCKQDQRQYAESQRIIHNLFAGKFELKKFNVYDNKGEYLHGSFFLGIGSINGGTTDEHKVSFCWKYRRNEYIITKIDVSNVKVSVEPGLQKAYVTFIGKFNSEVFPESIDTFDVNASFDQFMTIVIVHCNEEDFQTDININSLK